MQSIPNEVLIDIFSLCIEDAVLLNPERRCAIPLDPLSEVCTRWRSVILGTPGFWANLIVDLNDLTDTKRLVKTAHSYLSRSGNIISISISLYARSRSPSHQVADPEGHPIYILVIPFANRLRELKLSLPFEWLVEFLRLPPRRMEALEYVYLTFLSPGPHMHEQIAGQPILTRDAITIFADSPNLHSLTLTLYPGAPRDRDTRHPSNLLLLSDIELAVPKWAQLTHLDLVGIQVPYCLLHNILQKCPNLVSCAFTTYPARNEIMGRTLLAYLKTLMLDFQTTARGYLTPFELPALEHLIIHGSTRHGILSKCISAMIIRSPVRSIFISPPIYNSYSMERLLHAAPSLVELEATRDCALSNTILEKMKSRTLVPCLERLACPLQIDLLDAFIDVLESRWAFAGVAASHPAIHTAEISCCIEEAYLGGFDRDEFQEMAANAEARLRGLGAKAEGIRLIFND